MPKERYSSRPALPITPPTCAHMGVPNRRWVGYIKEYDGGTLMECYIHPAVHYRNVSQVWAVDL